MDRVPCSMHNSNSKPAIIIVRAYSSCSMTCTCSYLCILILVIETMPTIGR